jgi:hypothetical protein
LPFSPPWVCRFVACSKSDTKKVGDDAKAAADATKQAATDAADATKNAASNAADSAKQAASDASHTAKDKTSEAAETTKDKLSKAELQYNRNTTSILTSTATGWLFRIAGAKRHFPTASRAF